MFLDKKAQANSPFELLVAIIIMSFVIIIGAQMIGATNDQVCLANVEKAMTEFKLKLEETASYRTSHKFFFKPNQNNCYVESKTIMKIEVVNKNSRLCSAACGRAVDSCFLLVFNSTDLEGGFKQKCLNLPSYTSFVSGSACPTTETDLRGFESINPTEPNTMLLPGNYVLRNVAPVGKKFPEICVYWKR